METTPRQNFIIDSRSLNDQPTAEAPFWVRLLQRLTEPSPRLKDEEQIRRSRLIATMLVAGIVVGVFIIVYAVATNPVSIRTPDTWTGLAGVISALGLLVYLRRSGNIQVAAWLTVAMTWGVFVPPAFAPGVRTTLIYFAITPILIAAIFFRPRAMIWVTLSVIAGIVIGGTAFGAASRLQLYAVQFMIFVSALIVAFVNHERRTEELRRKTLLEANQKLRASEASLERRVQERTSDLERAQKRAERLALIGQDINAAQNYIEIVGAIARHHSDKQANIILSIYEDFAHETADYFEIMALRPSGSDTVIKPDARLNASNQLELSRVPVVAIEDIEESVLTADVQAFCRTMNARALLVAGLSIGGRVIGTLSLSSSTVTQFTDSNKQYLRTIADMVAAAVERTRLVEDLRSARNESERLYSVTHAVNSVQSFLGVVDAIATHFADPMANIALALFEGYDHKQASTFAVVAARPSGTPRAVLINQTYPADLIQSWVSREIFVVEDFTNSAYLPKNVVEFYLARNTLSMMVATIWLGDRAIGVLNVTSTVPHRYSVAERVYLRAVADIAAAAIDRIRLFNEQVDTAEKLRSVDQMKSQFLASMSHELRTPLNAILNFTEFVSLGMLGEINEAQRDALSKALESGRHLLALINDVLDMTKIEAGMMTLFIEHDVDLHHELNQVIGATQSLLKDKPVQFIQEIDGELPKISGDRRRIRQILLNLLSNAAKFTEEGSITFKAYREGREVAFDVLDTGPGIDPCDHELIFAPFRQTTRGVEHANGTGLGLPITKRLIEAHGGSIRLESALGTGAKFYVRLPIEAQVMEALPQ